MTAWPITIDAVYGCWLWREKDRDAEGYGISYRGRTRRRAHLAVYEAEVGPIGEGRELDHLCNRPFCVAPYHLEPVTRDENERRKRWRYRLKLRVCVRGHVSGDAMTTPEGGRVCRQCAKEAG